MEKAVYTLGSVSIRLGVAKHVIDYIYSSGKLSCPQMLSGRKIFYIEDIKILEEFLDKEKLKGTNNKNLNEVKNGNETK